MPASGEAVAVAVQENNHRGKVIVVVDDVLEVGKGFAALVLWCMGRGVGVIDRVNVIAPSGK